jgi:hypothetical protein
MTYQLHSNRPPCLAELAVSLFAPSEQAESILGDLHEEFSQVGSKSGRDIARRWYWRQSFLTIVQLAGSGFRCEPWSTVAVVLAGFLLLRTVHRLPGLVLDVVTDRYLIYWSSHFHAYLWVLKGLWIEYLMGSLFTGCVIALLAKRREMVATMTLAFILSAMVVVGTVWAVVITTDASYLWNLIWSFADPFAIVIGGVIVRMHRSSAKTRPSAA